MHPFQAVAYIEQALVARGGVLFSSKFSEVEEPHQTEAMICRHDNHVPVARQVARVLIRSSARSNGEAASMAIEHDRTLVPVSRRRPHVEIKAILGRHTFAGAERRSHVRLQRRRP